MIRSKSKLVIIAILFSSISLFAQTDSVKCNSQIQFHLINGYSLSYLNLFNSTTGIRFKVDLGLNGSSGNKDRSQNYYSTLNKSQKFKEDQANSTQYFNTAVNYMWRSNIAKEINIYFGIGPLISYSRNHTENNSETMPSTENSYSKSFYETTSSSFGLGIQGVIGVECNIAEKISLLAEFNLNGTYSWEHWKYIYETQYINLNRTENTEDGNSWNYGLNNLKIGIAYRF
jgi:hypothetical protein